jgi:hypothetical protein
MLHRHLLAAGILACAASPAFAVEVSRSVEVAATPAKAWEAIGHFCGIGVWHPAIAKCELGVRNAKPMRTLSLKGGGTILEEETERTDRGMSYSYIILESPLAVSDYKSTIAVKENGSHTSVVWSGDFKAKGASDAKAAEVITGIYDAGLGALKARLK